MAIIAILLLVGGMVGGGVGLFWAGMRGRVVDEHPVCAKCGFDLTGRAEGSLVCSECGGNLGEKGAVRVGNRVRRGGLVAVGGVMGVVGMLGVAGLGWLVVENVDWVRVEPMWMVLRGAKDSSVMVRNQALGELLRRMQGNGLSRGQMERVVSEALTAQGDAGRVWDNQWGEMVETARGMGGVSDEVWRRYLVQGPRFELLVRKVARRGESVRAAIKEGPARAALLGKLWVRESVRVMSDSDVVGAPEEKPGEENWGGSGLNSGSVGTTSEEYAMNPKKLAEAADGEKRLHVQVTAEIYDSGAVSVNPVSGPVVVVKKDLWGTWRLAPAGEETVKGLDVPGARGAGVEGAISVEGVSLGTDGWGQNVRVRVRVRNSPMPLAYRVVLRSGGKEWEAGTVYGVAGLNTGWETGREVKGFDAEKVDVVFVPDAEVVRGTVDMTEYWTGGVVIKGVGVKRLGK